ncbi:hybrid sensor histidine kinase/response regulator [Ramlibacter sp. AN1133]|uniref:hybrid sensor histidine kinase/response regulator n=1 Tax=Ramlibacter sp. AN1133 TaxID=3133429 RepID=UPI0030BE24EB
MKNPPLLFDGPRRRAFTKGLSIQSRLVLLVLATAVPLLAFAVALVFSHSRSAESLAREAASRTAAAAMQAIDRELSGAITGLQVLAASPSLRDMDFRAFHAQARSAVGLAGNSVIILYDREGRRIVSTAVAYGEPLPPRKDMSVLATPFRTGQPFVSSLFVSETVKQPTVGVVVPVIFGGEVRFVLAAGLLSSRLSELLLSSGLPPHWIAAVLDQEGTIIARTRNPGQYVGTKALPEVWSAMQALPGPVGRVDGPTKEGNSAWLAFARSGKSGWSSVVAIPAAAMQRKLRTSVAMVAGAGAAVVLLALLLSWWAVQPITQPVSRLEALAKALEEGREVVPVATGIWQFDHLAHAMEHAGRAIRLREAKLSESLANLRAAHQQLRDEDGKKDQFIATLAHELRNPLAPIRSGVDLLEGAPPPEVAARTVQMMDRQVRHMTRLIEDLLDVSRIARGTLVMRLQDADLRAVVGDAVDAVKPHIEAGGQHLVAELPQGPLAAHVDPVRLTQVVTNLLHNAAKFSAPGALITVRAAVGPAEAEISVSDTGIGIAPEKLERIFDPFFQVRTPDHLGPPGLGMGLSLSRRLIELHGGSIRAYSEGPGRGATFVVRIPSTQRAPRVPALLGTSGGLPRRVLVVDDNRDAADAVAALFVRAGHSVQLAYDGPSALAVADERDFDLVLLDIGMPGMSGYEVCQRLRQSVRAHSTRIVALTGWGSEADREKSLDAGFDAHLTKPASWHELEQLL